MLPIIRCCNDGFFFYSSVGEKTDFYLICRISVPFLFYLYRCFRNIRQSITVVLISAKLYGVTLYALLFNCIAVKLPVFIPLGKILKVQFPNSIFLTHKLGADKNGIIRIFFHLTVEFNRNAFRTIFRFIILPELSDFNICYFLLSGNEPSIGTDSATVSCRFVSFNNDLGKTFCLRILCYIGV